MFAEDGEGSDDFMPEELEDGIPDDDPLSTLSEEAPLQTPVLTMSPLPSRSPSPMLSQARKRAAELPLAQTVYRRPRKATGPEVIRDGLKAVADSIIVNKENRDAGAERKLSDSETAQQRLISEYPYLDPAAMVELMDILEDPIKARSFLILPPGPVRDAWVLKRLPESIRNSAAASILDPMELEGFRS